MGRWEIPRKLLKHLARTLPEPIEGPLIEICGAQLRNIHGAWRTGCCRIRSRQEPLHMPSINMICNCQRCI